MATTSVLENTRSFIMTRAPVAQPECPSSLTTMENHTWWDRQIKQGTGGAAQLLAQFYKGLGFAVIAMDTLQVSQEFIRGRLIDFTHVAIDAFVYPCP